jgi:membrane-associated phospholipid phosphatase
MGSYKKTSLFSLFIGCFFWAPAQLMTDTIINDKQNFRQNLLKMNAADKKKKDRFPSRSLLIPGVMIAYGISSIEVEVLEQFNAKVNDEIYAEEPHRKLIIDDYLQFSPGIAVYGLNAMGIKGKHNFRDRTAIYLISNALLGTSVYAAKKISRELRPDASGYTSFPSGHTAEAFASAEFLRMEYKGLSPWYGYAGYGVALATGYLRMYNNKHWLGDIVAGAGIGIASTKIAYWLYPKIQQWLFKGRNSNTIIMPLFTDKTPGLVMIWRF